MGCDLEVDVNGEEVFLVDKGLLSSFSGKLGKLFGKSTTASNLKVIFHDLPGGPEAFELVTRFCYNNGQAAITPSNLCLLHSIGHYMEMTEDVSPGNLIKQAGEFLEGIAYWAWADILVLLKQCQKFSLWESTSQLLQTCLDSIAVRITSASDTTTPSSSPDLVGCRLSCDTRSTDRSKFPLCRTWWFDDLVLFDCDIIEKLMKRMMYQKLDHPTICRFLFYYHKLKVSGTRGKKKCKTIETVINLLFLLNSSSVTCNGLFGVLRAALSSNISKTCKYKLENMIGSRLDQATLDSLLLPARVGMDYLYDVDLVLRFLRSFLCSGFQASSSRLKRAGALVDMYITEVAPDSCLKPSKFVALAMALPDSARESHDEMYQAVDLYLEVHTGLSEEEKSNVCSVLNYEKLSSEACKHLACNSKFPSKTAIQALTSQQPKLKSSLQDIGPPKSINGELRSLPRKPIKVKKDNCHSDKVVLYSKKLELSPNDDDLKTHMKRIHWRVMELENVYKNMQSQMTNIMKSRLPSRTDRRPLPKMCS